MLPKTFSCLAAGLILAAVAAASSAQTQAYVSVGAPGFYGAIDVGDAPPPNLIYRQPVAIQPVVIGMAPLYLYVPPEQYADWGSYCGYYNACNRNVYFVDRGWYQRVYVPHYRSHRSYYDHRRAEFDRHSYRSAGRDRHRSPPHVDGHRPPPRADGYRSSPRADGYQRFDNRRPSVREEHRNAPPPRSDSNRPPVEEGSQSAPPPRSDNNRPPVGEGPRSAPSQPMHP